MGSHCSANKQGGNGGQGFNDGQDHGGFNPGNNSHRPDAHRAGNMPEAQPPAVNAGNAEATGAPAQAPAPQANAGAQAPQAPQANNGQAPRPYIDFDPRTGKAMLMPGQKSPEEYAVSGNIPLNDKAANARAFAEAVGNVSGKNENEYEAPQPQPVDVAGIPQAEPFGSPLFIGAATGNLGDGNIVQHGHWEEFEKMNNVIPIEQLGSEFNLGHQNYQYN